MLEGNQNAKIGAGNDIQFITSDLTNENVLKLINELNKTNEN